MLDHGQHICFSVPASDHGKHQNNGRIVRSVAKLDQPKQGLLEGWLERGKTEQFPVEHVKINPELAEALLRLNTHNRNLKPTVVDQYAHIMRCGEWKSTVEAIAIDRNGVLLNGQHRLEAVKKAQVTVEFTFWFGVDPEEFKIIDQGSKRGAKDLVQINGYSYEGIRAPVAKILLILESGNASYKPAPQFVSDRVSLLGDRLERASYWGAKMKIGKEDGKITSATAAALAYYVIQEAGAPYDKIERFFTVLLNGRDEEVVTPKIVTDLRGKLMGRGPLAAGHDVSTNIKRAAAIILSWNIYRRNLKKANIIWNPTSSLPPATP